MSTPSLTAQVAQCECGNLGVAVKPLNGEVRRVPLATANVNVDEEGNLGVFAAGGSTTPGTGGLSQQQILALIDARLTGYIRADDIPILDALIDEMEGLNLFDP